MLSSAAVCESRQKSQCQSFPNEAPSSVEAWTHKRCDLRVIVQGECRAGSSSSHHPLTVRVMAFTPNAKLQPSEEGVGC